VDFEARLVWLNGSPGVRIDVRDQFTGAVNFTVEEGRITGIYAISNPQKLARIDAIASISRS
jgi:RNA polymerase sigma-70 factor (ECF subfamily)